MPGARRFYVQNQGLEKDLFLRDTEHNHLANVLRLRIGDKIIAMCGDEYDYTYEITRITKNETSLMLINKSPNMHNPQKQLTVYIGAIKHDNLALAIEKLNEIGVTEVVIFKSERSQDLPRHAARATPSSRRGIISIDKLQTTANQSCKQCGRSIPLKARGVLTFSDMLIALPKENVYYADESSLGEKETLASLRANATQSLSEAQGCSIIIGPEGGFTDIERGKLRALATPISLGARILRAETAAIISATILLSIMGEI